MPKECAIDNEQYANNMAAKSVKGTTVYKKTFELAMEIFNISKEFPPE